MMKCPTCGGPLKPSKKDPDYLLCYTCKKKFKVPQHQAEDVAPKAERMSAKKEAGDVYKRQAKELIRLQKKWPICMRI